MKESNGSDDEIENAIVKGTVIHSEKGFVEVGDPRPPQHLYYMPKFIRFVIPVNKPLLLDVTHDEIP